MIFLLSRYIDPEILDPTYDRDSGMPYRPSQAPDMSPILKAAAHPEPPEPYQRLGLQAARRLLVRS